ncbi:ATP-binding protein [Porphyromonas sp.]|uniref:AAA family ATPase n=1 Tax=Porphyromonas sp. TaxID=1924944 RepID=UPI0026DDB50F|nr:ATP-binding protein [Porphyromonas sp.]MDO4771668.1 ATP-binding protein [Porphyromonas sp.]
MKKDGIMNPFVVGRYVSDTYFCDRETETAFLLKQIENGRNVAMISPRRMGKTGLIRHCFAQDRVLESYHTFFIDLYATTSLAELVYLLGKTIYEELRPKKTAWAEKFFHIISSLRVGFKLDPLSGQPTFDIGLGDIHTPQATLDEIFEYLESADRPCVVAIDEFQQVGEYEDKSVEALLRTKIQQCKQTIFIFAGSKRHLMSNMFNSPAKPFYQSAISIGLDSIPVDVYVDFAARMFEMRGKRVDSELVREVYRLFEGCTWFVQMMMNELFALTADGATCGMDKLPIARENIIQVQRHSYKELLLRLASRQKLLLQSVAREGRVRGITSGPFIKKYNLSSASSVQAALKPLLKYDFVTQDGEEYRVYDYFFAEWLVKEY